MSVETKHQTIQGLAFPLQQTAKRALQQLAQKHINYIQLVRMWYIWVRLLTRKHRAVWCQERWHARFLQCIYFVVLQRLDVQKEIIELVHSNPTETRDLPSRVPKDTPRYHFFLYKHSHEGDYLESVGMCVCEPEPQKLGTESLLKLRNSYLWLIQNGLISEISCEKILILLCSFVSSE